jgi:hypothetical protein
VLVEELLIPHPTGPVHVSLGARVTVLTGLDGPGREHLAHLLASGLAGAGPATVVVRDDLGQPGRIEPGTAAGSLAPRPDAEAELRRRMVVGPAELGGGEDRPDPALAAERTAVAIAHRQLVRELSAVEAGAAERARLLVEIGDEGHDPTGRWGVVSPLRAPDLDGVATSATRIDELLQRRRDARKALERTTAVLRSIDEDPTRPPPPAAGDLRIAGGPLATRVLAALDVVRRVSGSIPTASADHRRAETDARIALARARADVEQARADAEADIEACDHELAALARAADVPIGPEGPGAALIEALAHRRYQRRQPLETDPVVRLLARRRASLRARIAELPDDADLAATRRQLDAVADRLARLESGGVTDVESLREALLARIALLRPDGVTAIAPLVLDEALGGLAPDDLLDLLDLLVRVSERTQIVVLTGDAAIATWARYRAAGGDVLLLEMART